MRELLLAVGKEWGLGREDPLALFLAREVAELEVVAGIPDEVAGPELVGSARVEELAQPASEQEWVLE